MKRRLQALFVTMFFAGTMLIAANEAGVTKVLDYLPAPGQFTNALPKYDAGDTKQDMLDKCLARMQDNKYISLGGFGGYVVLGFDHPILNVEGEYDLIVDGNAMGSSKEPAIVMVSKDENGNGLADDTWYELAGSNYGGAKNITNFSMTYFDPSTPKSPVAWTNSLGQSGTNPYLPTNTFIDPERLIDRNYPMWIDEDSITFTGTLIDFSDVAGMTWGYADLMPNNTDGAKLKIDWAVDAHGNAVELSSIDFVKIYNCISKINQPFGEVSTEVINVRDLHPDATLPIVAATFEDLTLEPESADRGLTEEFERLYAAGALPLDMYGTPFLNRKVVSGSYQFSNIYSRGSYVDGGGDTITYDMWAGMAYSNSTSTGVDSYSDCNSAAGGAAHGNIFASINSGMAVSLVDGVPAHVISGCYVTNNGYTVKSMKNGDAFAKKFAQGDWLKLTVKGYNGETSTNAVEFYLADFRSENAADHYILEEWEWLDLTSLGVVDSLAASLNSSDVGDSGMNTPNYFCIDNLNKKVPTSIFTPNESKLNVFVQGNTVFVSGAEIGETLNIYSVTGTLLSSKVVSDETEIVSLPQTGVAIVKAGGQASKVIIK